MVKTRECSEFDRLWNERLDHRDRRSPGRDQFLDDHAARCELCRSRALVYADLGALRRRATLGPAPSAEAAGRWQAALTAAATRQPRAPILIPIPAPTPTPAPGRAERRARLAVRAGMTALAAAVILLAGQVMLPVLFPVEPVLRPQVGTAPPAPPFEEAFREATEATRELAHEIAAPANPFRPPVPEATDQAGTLASRPFSFVPAEPIAAAPSTAPDAVGLSPDQNRRAFRFLGGSNSDEMEDPYLVEGQ